MQPQRRGQEQGQGQGQAQGRGQGEGQYNLFVEETTTTNTTNTTRGTPDPRDWSVMSDRGTVSAEENWGGERGRAGEHRAGEGQDGGRAWWRL